MGGGYLTDENGVPVESLINPPKCVENSVLVWVNVWTVSGYIKNTSSSTYNMENLKN